MRIIVDAMGGDNAPEEIVKGAVRAKRELGVDVTSSASRIRSEPASRPRAALTAR